MSERIKTDVLIAGGGIAGLAAAIAAKESAPDIGVTIVEKYTSGYSGKANRGAGIMVTLADYKPEEFVRYHADRIGKYLNDQEFLMKYAREINNNVEALDRWSNGKIDRDEKGEIRTVKWRSQLRGVGEDGVYDFDQSNEYPWTLAAIDLDFLLNVRKTAVKLGVKFIDRVGIVDILTAAGGEACGAVGFGIDTGEAFVFEARAVVLATGGQNYRVMPMWACARGEGIAAAWRAGASLTNGEFGSFYNWTSPHNFKDEMGVEYGLYNDKGENVGARHTVEPHPDIDPYSLAEYYKQVKAGNGPLHYRQDENVMLPFTRSMLGSNAAYFKRPFANKWWGKLIFNGATQEPDDVIMPGLVGEYGAVKVGEDFQTRIPGLFAIGEVSIAGTRCFGAVPAPPARVRGIAINVMTFHGRAAGPAAAAYAASVKAGAISDTQAEAVVKRFNAPLSRAGDIPVNDFVFEIMKVMQPVGNSLYRHEARMGKALGRILELREQMGRIDAEAPHHLFGVNEIDATLLCAEMFFRASLERKDSIGWFLREDYPDPPDDLEWIVIENDGGKPKIVKEPVPIERYPFKPEM
ncbi:MAG: FAD-binding protein [Clostridiales bacterium]|nr:FAD-binding protein [Clostridiales bacterium]